MSDPNAEHGNHITNAKQHDHNETHTGHIHGNDTEHIHGNVTGNTNDHADGHNHSDHGHDHEHKDTDGGQHNHGDHHPHDKTHTTTKTTQVSYHTKLFSRDMSPLSKGAQMDWH